MKLYITVCLCYAFVSLSLFAIYEATGQTCNKRGVTIEETTTIPYPAKKARPTAFPTPRPMLKPTP